MSWLTGGGKPWAETKAGQREIAKGRSGGGGGKKGSGGGNNPLRTAWKKAETKKGTPVHVDINGQDYTVTVNPDGSSVVRPPENTGLGAVTWNPGVEPHT